MIASNQLRSSKPDVFPLSCQNFRDAVQRSKMCDKSSTKMNSAMGFGRCLATPHSRKKAIGVQGREGKKTGYLAAVQQSSHLEVAHGKGSFLEQPGQFALDNLRGSETSALLDNKNLVRTRRREKLRFRHSSLGAPIRVDHVKWGRQQHAMRLYLGGAELLNLGHIKLLPPRGNVPFVNEMKSGNGSKNRANRTTNLLSNISVGISLYLFSSME